MTPLELITAVMESHLRGPCLAVALVICRRDGICDGTGKGCIHGLSKLAHMAGHSERATSDALAQLQEAGLITVEHRPGKGCTRRLLLDKVMALSEAFPAKAKRKTKRPAHAATHAPAATPAPDATHAPAAGAPLRPLQGTPAPPADEEAFKGPEKRPSPPSPPKGASDPDPVLVHPVEAPEADPYATWRRLNDVYASLPGCKRLRSPAKGLGLALQRIAEAHGYDDGRRMLLWMAYATGCPKAASLDEGGYRTLGTVGRVGHVDDYWTHVCRWVRAGMPGLPGGIADAKRSPHQRQTSLRPPGSTYDPNNPRPRR